MQFQQDIPLDAPSEHTFPFALLFAACADKRANTTDLYQRDHFPFTNFEYILEGEGTLIVEGREYTLRQGDVYTLPKGSAHTYYPNPNNPWRKMHVTLDGDLVKILLQAYRLTHLRVIHAPETEQYFREWIQLKMAPHDRKHHLASLIFQKMLLDLSLLDNPKSSSMDEKVQCLMSRLDSSLESKVQLRELCCELNLNERMISRKFKSEVGYSPYEYLLEQRLNLAVFLLSYSDLKIGDIAAKLQFSDIYTFSNFFKKRKGISPRKYKNA